MLTVGSVGTFSKIFSDPFLFLIFVTLPSFLTLWTGDYLNGNPHLPDSGFGMQ